MEPSLHFTKNFCNYVVTIPSLGSALVHYTFNQLVLSIHNIWFQLWLLACGCFLPSSKQRATEYSWCFYIIALANSTPKSCPSLRSEGIWRSGCIAPPILNVYSYTMWKWVASINRSWFTPENECRYPLCRNWVGPRAGLDILKRILSCQCRNSNPGFLPSHYTDYTLLELHLFLQAAWQTARASRNSHCFP